MAKTRQKPAVLYRINVAPDSWLFPFSWGGKWQVWKRYKTPGAANEALDALRKSKPGYYEFKVRHS